MVPVVTCQSGDLLQLSPKKMFAGCGAAMRMFSYRRPGAS